MTLGLWEATITLLPMISHLLICISRATTVRLNLWSVVLLTFTASCWECMASGPQDDLAEVGSVDMNTPLLAPSQEPTITWLQDNLEGVANATFVNAGKGKKRQHALSSGVTSEYFWFMVLSCWMINFYHSNCYKIGSKRESCASKWSTFWGNAKAYCGRWWNCKWINRNVMSTSLTIYFLGNEWPCK